LQYYAVEDVGYIVNVSVAETGGIPEKSISGLILTSKFIAVMSPLDCI
jgi:hypothetical protein